MPNSPVAPPPGPKHLLRFFSRLHFQGQGPCKTKFSVCASVLGV